ncbi:hypothetical protein IEQ34_001870 [Dendrobium chrysotoxum]|uniref:Glycosyl transferase 48 domain-containing protein n=1 Tax=Dendrobium chrysotoxum TaxID=161865 RepID=A0AAV7HLW1_DENCH|nr:hypothetical protein IEQ34_001870 [Dendrobium chrysotoxum]
MFSYYFTTVGFYVSSIMVVIIVHIFLDGKPYLSLMFFTFLLGTKSHYFGQTILHGGAKYRATGRRFVERHVKFVENYRMYSISHFIKGLELMLSLIVYQTYGSTTTDSTTFLLLTASIRFLWKKIVEDWDNLSKWIKSEGIDKDVKLLKDGIFSRVKREQIIKDIELDHLYLANTDTIRVFIFKLQSIVEDELSKVLGSPNLFCAEAPSAFCKPVVVLDASSFLKEQQSKNLKKWALYNQAAWAAYDQIEVSVSQLRGRPVKKLDTGNKVAEGKRWKKLAILDNLSNQII